MDKIEKNFKPLSNDKYLKIDWDKRLSENNRKKAHPKRDLIVEQAYKIGLTCVDDEDLEFPFITGFKKLHQIIRFAYAFDCNIGNYCYCEEVGSGSVWLNYWLDAFEITDNLFNSKDLVYGVSVQIHSLEEENEYLKDFRDHYFCLGKGIIERV